jgi:DNA-binding MarR family transcriptional regulator
MAMNSLVLEIQREALDPSVPILSLLQKAWVLARKLEVSELEEWIKQEINGYSDSKDVPIYRIVKGQPIESNPIQAPSFGESLILSLAEGMLRGLAADDGEQIMSNLFNQKNQMAVNNPIGEMQGWLEDRGGDFITLQTVRLISQNPTWEELIRGFASRAVPISLQVHKSQIFRTIQAVRAVVLAWTVKLEQDGILGNGLSFSPGEKIKASQYYNVETLIQASEGITMSENYTTNFERSNINNFANKLQDQTRQQGKQDIYQSEQEKTLEEAASEIQKLLKQLEKDNPSATEIEKITYVNNKTNHSLKRRVVSALQAGGEAAIEEFLDNAYVNVGKAIVKGWVKPE